MPKSEQLQIRTTPAQKTELRRRARRAGVDLSTYVLARALPPTPSRVASVIGELGSDDDRTRYALAELNDLLTGLTGAEFEEAVAEIQIGGLSQFLRNYVAAMVEHAAARKHRRPPDWVREVEPLTEPYFAVPFARLRPYLLRSAPAAFKRRNLFVDSTVGDRV